MAFFDLRWWSKEETTISGNSHRKKGEIRVIAQELSINSSIIKSLNEQSHSYEPVWPYIKNQAQGQAYFAWSGRENRIRRSLRVREKNYGRKDGLWLRQFWVLLLQERRESKDRQSASNLKQAMKNRHGFPDPSIRGLCSRQDAGKCLYSSPCLQMIAIAWHLILFYIRERWISVAAALKAQIFKRMIRPWPNCGSITNRNGIPNNINHFPRPSTVLLDDLASSFDPVLWTFS